MEEQDNGAADISLDKDLVTVRDIMNNLEEDIRAILSSEIDEKTARIIVSARKAQLQGAGLHIAAARLSVAMRKEVPGWLGAAKPKQA